MTEHIKLQMKVYDETGRRRDIMSFLLPAHWTVEDAQDWMQQVRSLISANEKEITDHGPTH